MNNHFKELPNEYKEIYSIDAKDKKIGIILNVGCLILMLITFLITINIKFPRITFDIDTNFLIAMILFFLIMLIYIVLHELVHGLFYKILTKEKLTFGLSWSCAYCGVPNVFVKRNATVITCLAPFVIFNIIYIVLICALPPNIYTFIITILFSYHIGGCIGDLYLSLLLLIKYNKETIVNDTGAKQIIYTK